VLEIAVTGGTDAVGIGVGATTRAWRADAVVVEPTAIRQDDLLIRPRAVIPGNEHVVWMRGANAKGTAPRIHLAIGAREFDRHHVREEEVRVSEHEQARRQIDRVAVLAAVVGWRALSGPEARVGHHGARKLVDLDPRVGDDVDAVLGDGAVAIDVPAAVVGIVVPKVESHPRRLVDSSSPRNTRRPRGSGSLSSPPAPSALPGSGEQIMGG